MQIKSAEFLKSSAHLKDCPVSSLPEYAFIGRSNVGKSSLINMLTGHRKLAKTSGTPGKTQLINHFLINGSWFLTDLPGFGYAKVSKKAKGNFERMIKEYLLNRQNLVSTFLLVDGRHEPHSNDLEFMEWMGLSKIAFVIIFTKCDKLGKTKLESNLNNYQKTLGQSWDPIPKIILSSSQQNIGREEILGFIEKYNNPS